MLDFLFSLLLALLVMKNRIHLELNIPQFFQIGIDRFQLSGFSGVLLHEHFQFRLPLFRGQLFAGKAGVIQLTRSLAVEWAKRGVRVNSISPGYIGTDLTLSSETLKPLIAQWNAMAPMGRLGRPEELESICVYLAGDTSSFTTGADFGLDGAFTCF